MFVSMALFSVTAPSGAGCGVCPGVGACMLLVVGSVGAGAMVGWGFGFFMPILAQRGPGGPVDST